MTRFFFHKALWFKEWRQQRVYILPALILFSISPLMYVFASDISTGTLLRENILTIHLRGPGIMMLVVSLGLAILTIRLDTRDGGIQIGSEPIPRRPLLLIKYLVGIGVLIAAQTAVAIWIGFALMARHALSPISILTSWWLISMGIEISCYAVCFALSHIIRRWLVCAVFTCTGLLLPLYVGSEVYRIRFNYLMATGEQIKAIRAHTLDFIGALSPFWYLRFGPIFNTDQSDYISHLWELLFWLVLSVLAVTLFAGVNSIDTRSTGSSRFPKSLRRIVISAVTLITAVLAQHFVLHIPISSMPVRIVAILLLWLCLYLALHGAWQMRAERRRESRDNGQAFRERGQIS